MALYDELSLDWTREIPFYLAAAGAHVAFLLLNPTLQWGLTRHTITASAPVEFVRSLPVVAPKLSLPAPRALRPSGGGRRGAVKGKTKARARKPLVRRKPADPRILAQRAEARRIALEAQKAAELAMAAAVAKRTEERRAAAQAAAAAARQARAKKRAELAQTLAMMSNPDEKLDASAPGSGVSSAGAAAALAETSDPDSSADGGNGSGNGDDPAGLGEEASWSMEGEGGHRRLVSRAAPTSPDWVGTRGLDLRVTVRFQVLASGSIKPGAVVQKSSGFPEIDQLALGAISRWKFQPAPGAAPVWGRAVFRFTR